MLGAGAVEVPQARSTPPRLLRRMPMSGWSGPRAASLIWRARSCWVRAPSRSPSARSTPPRLLRRTPMVGWSGPRAASPIWRARSYWVRAPSRSPRRADAAEVAAPDADVGVVGSEGGLADLEGSFVLGAGAVEVPQAPQHAAELVAALAHRGVVGPEAGLGDVQGAFGQRPGLPVLTPPSQVGRCPVQEPPGVLARHVELFGVLGGGQEMGQQFLAGRPLRDLPTLVGERGAQDPDRGFRPFPLLGGAEPGPDHGLDQPVQADGGGGEGGEGVAAEHGEGPVVGQRVGHRGGQTGRQDLGVRGGEGAGDVGAEEREQAQQRLGGGGLLADPVQRHRPHGGDPALISLRPTDGGGGEFEQFRGAVADQRQVVVEPGPGFLEVGGGLLQRQREVPEQLRQRIQPGVVGDGGAVLQEAHRFARGPARPAAAARPASPRPTSVRSPAHARRPRGGSSPSRASGCSALS